MTTMIVSEDLEEEAQVIMIKGMKNKRNGSIFPETGNDLIGTHSKQSWMASEEDCGSFFLGDA